MSIWHLMKREFRQLFVTDRRRATFLFGASLAYLLLFSLLYSPHVITGVPLVIYDQDQTSFSRSLSQAFADSERFHIVGYVTSQEDMEEELQEKTAYAAISIPAKFSQDVKAGRASSALLVVDGANIVITNTVTSAAQEIISSFAAHTASSLTELAGQLPTMAQHRVNPVELRFQILHNPTLSYHTFFVLGLAMAALQQGVFLSVGASLTHEYHSPGELSAASLLTILAGKLIPYWLSALLAFALTLTVAVQGFGLPLQGDLLSLFLLAAVFLGTAIAFSTFVAALCNNELTFTKISISYTVPAFVLSGYTWPLSAMDTISQVISYAFPYTYFVTTLREMMVAGYSPSLYSHIAILFAMGVVFLGTGAWLYARKRKQLHLSLSLS